MSGSFSRREVLAAIPLSFASSAGGAVRPWNRPATLGKSGLAVTALGMGCEDLRDPDLIRQAAGLGINHFHTLSNFEVVGRAVRPIRSQIVLGAGSSEQSGPAMLKDMETYTYSIRPVHTVHLERYWTAS